MTAPSTPAKAPVGEAGYTRARGNWWAPPEVEETPELRWPDSIAVYDRMRRQDAQIASVLRAVTLPVRRTPWRIDPTDCRPEVVQLVSEDLGLPVRGQDSPPLPRTRDRFSWQQHLRDALLMLVFGHSYFEQVYRLDELGRARLRKLGSRPARTIEKIDVADDGGLAAVQQWGRMGGKPVIIPVTRLVAYVHEQEAGDWVGTSLLRPAYKDWLLKDRALRGQAITLDRNGMGVPRYTGPENPAADDLDKGQQLAAGWRSGDASGAALPFGAKLDLVGVDGSLPDYDKPIRYHDEQIARAVLAHFLNLGTQTGSWALGSTFADFFTLSLQTLAAHVADVATQHVVEDLVDVNFGTAEAAPRVIFDEIGSKQALTAQALKLLLDSGALSFDPALELAVRQQYGLPPATAQPPAPVTEDDL